MTSKILVLGRAIKQLQNSNHRRLESALRAVDSSLAQWDALRAIGGNPGASAHALAEETFQTDQALGTLVTRMIAKGLVERQQGPGRALQHHLTANGQAVLAQAMQIATEVIGEAFKGLSAAERAQLLHLVRKVQETGGPL